MLSQSLVALVTPMKLDGSVDYPSLKRLVDYHACRRTSGIVVLGTTGEAATFGASEHVDVVTQVVKFGRDRIPIFAGNGSNCTNRSIFLTSLLENTGICGCLNVVPYYNKPNQEGLFRHFRAIARSTRLPQIVYNVPSRTGCDLTPYTVSRLSRIRNVVGLKDAAPDLSRVAKIARLSEHGFALLGGDDATALDYLQLGGTGIVSVTANIAAEAMSCLCVLARKRKFRDARSLDAVLQSIHAALFCETNPVPIKWACKSLGLIEHDAVRLPLTTLCGAKKQIVRNALSSVVHQEFSVSSPH